MPTAVASTGISKHRLFYKEDSSINCNVLFLFLNLLESGQSSGRQERQGNRRHATKVPGYSRTRDIAVTYVAYAVTIQLTEHS